MYNHLKNKKKIRIRKEEILFSTRLQVINFLSMISSVYAIVAPIRLARSLIGKVDFKCTFKFDVNEEKNTALTIGARTNALFNGGNFFGETFLSFSILYFIFYLKKFCLFIYKKT